MPFSLPGPPRRPLKNVTAQISLLDRTFNDQEKNDMLKMAKIVNDLEDAKYLLTTLKEAGIVLKLCC